MTGPIHLQPTARLAERVLLPGDPGRALALAQQLLDSPKMFNHHRGLWGYTGTAADGELLTVQSTGMGGPSAAIVIAELHHLGARTLLRVGTCGALDPAFQLGELLIAAEVLPADGTSRALTRAERLTGDAALGDALAADGNARRARIVSTDLFYDHEPGREQAWAQEGVQAVEMETATLFALAARRSFRAASLLIVSDVVLPDRERIEADRLEQSVHELGKLAIGALARLRP
jgi:DeoD family purine-nucleoside phosphorylase